MSAQKVLARLEAMGILDPKVMGDLRRFLQEAKQPISAEAIVKLLVDKRQLTPFQAKKLLAEVVEVPAAAPPKAKPSPPPIPQAKKTVEEDELMLVDDPPPSTPAKSTEPDDEIVDLEEALPPATSETPIKATLRQVDTSPPTGEKKKKRVIMPPAPTAITTDDLMLPSPPAAPKPAEMKKTGAPPAKTSASKAAPVNASFANSLPGLQPLTELPASPLADGLKPLTPLGGGLDPLSNLSPLGANDALLGGLPGETLEETKPPEPEKTKLKKKKAGTWDSALLMLGVR